MNSSSPQQNEAALHAVDYWQVIKNRYGIILLTLLLVFMTASVITYVMPKKYESEAIIEVKPREVGMSPLGALSQGSSGSRMTPQFFGTEFEKIVSHLRICPGHREMQTDDRMQVRRWEEWRTRLSQAHPEI